jgi:hypothetical protein
MNLRLSALACVAVAFASGCGHYHHYGRTHVHSGGDEGVALVVGFVAGATVISATRENYSYRAPVVVQQNVCVNAPPPAPAPIVVPPPSPRDRVPASKDALPAFDAATARAQLSAADLSSCRDLGAPAGYGHAFVTFSPDGIVTKVVVDEPPGMTPEAVRCVGDQLGAIRVRPFRGSVVTMGTVWRVQ